MMMTTALISSTPSSIPSSKFARKEQLVYIVPSVVDCMALLPRHLGNYILSYTSAFLAFYIENLIIKYGEKFVNDIFINDVFTTTIFTKINKQTQSEKVARFIKRALFLNITRDLIISLFQTKIQERALLIQSQQQQKMVQKEQILTCLSIVNVGDIISANNKFYFIVEKSKLCYYSIEVMFDRIGSNRSEYNHLTLIYSTVDINQNKSFKNMIILPKKKFIITKHNSDIIHNPDITNKHKRAYVLDLFGYMKLSNNVFVRNLY